METYKEHKIVDYNHKYMFDGHWYKRNLGTPINIWQSEKTNKYTDRFEVERTAPPGTWWQTTKVIDSEAIQLIDDEKLNAYSLTTVNKQFLNKFLQMSNTGISTKNKDTLHSLLQEYNMSAKHRTPIAKINEPIAFTVSLTDFPCVGGAVFARDCLQESQGISIKTNRRSNMTEETKTNGGFSLNDVKELFGLFTSMKADEKPEEEEPARQEEETPQETKEYVTKEELDTTLEENNKKLIQKIEDIIDEKINNEEETDERKSEETSEPEPKDDKKDNPQISNKNGEQNMPIQPVSHQLDDPTNEGEYSHKKGTHEYRILQKLGRDALGNSKIRL